METTTDRLTAAIANLGWRRIIEEQGHVRRTLIDARDPSRPYDPVLIEYLEALDEMFSEARDDEYDVLSKLSDEDECW